MIKCNSCSTEFKDDANFCPACGARNPNSQGFNPNMGGNNYQQYQPHYGPYYGPTQPQATMSLILGILSLVFAGPIGLVMGIIAVVQGNKLKPLNYKYAKEGYILGMIGTIYSAVITLILVIYIIIIIAIISSFSYYSISCFNLLFI